MQESFLIFIDILGYEGLTRAAKSEAEQNDLLRRLHAALSRHVPILSHQDEKDFPSWYAARVFTDNIVLARPLFEFNGGEGESELGHMMLDAGLYQFNLALKGFYVRGGIAVGPAYVDDHIVFGPALIEAHDIEQERSVFPRIVVSEKAREYVKRHVGYYRGGASAAPHNSELLVDGDGEWFVNYMDAAREDSNPDLLTEYRSFVEQHRDAAVAQIRAHSTNRRVLEKYIWVSRYHNYVVGYLYPGERDLLVPENLLPGGFRRLADILSPSEYGLGVSPKRTTTAVITKPAHPGKQD